MSSIYQELEEIRVELCDMSNNVGCTDSITLKELCGDIIAIQDKLCGAGK